MSIYLLGMRTDVAYIGTSRFWADNGFVKYEDKLTGEFGSMSVPDAVERVQGIRAMIGTTANPGIELDIKEREVMMKYVEKMLAIIVKAKEQGMPTDPTAVRDREISRTKQFTVPLLFDF